MGERGLLSHVSPFSVIPGFLNHSLILALLPCDQLPLLLGTKSVGGDKVTEAAFLYILCYSPGLVPWQRIFCQVSLHGVIPKTEQSSSLFLAKMVMSCLSQQLSPLSFIKPSY